MAIADDGFSDSAAAIVTISMPPNANATANNPAATPGIPFGMKLPFVRLWAPTNSVSGKSPKINNIPTMRKKRITATLTNANQNSNSPNPCTFAKFTTAKNVTHTNAGIHGSIPNHCPMMPAAPVISAPITMVSMNQYNHPSENPAQCPNACSAYTANDPEFGRAAAISPSICIISSTIMPANT